MRKARVTAQAAKALRELLSHSTRRYALIGGAAVRAYTPRRLKDLDVLIDESAIASFLKHAPKYGYACKGNFAPICKHRSGTQLDVLPAFTKSERKALSERSTTTLFGETFKIPTRDTLVALKRESARDPTRTKKDLLDIERLLVSKRR